jgi:two-component system OmpR family sensor kinase
VTPHLSLRARLLVAIGITSIVGLVLVDVFVYSSLRSYEYGQVDNTLEQSHLAVEQMSEHPGATLPEGDEDHAQPGKTPPAGGSESGPAGQPGSSSFCDAGRENAPGMFIEVLDRHDRVVTATAGREYCPAFEPGSTVYYPDLPHVLTGFKRYAVNPGEPTAYLTVASTKAGGPSFRVQASKLANDKTLVLATPVSNVTDTLSRLVVIELLVTAGALIAAIALGLWLVRVGLRPLREVEMTADAIALGDLEQRAPNPDDRTEVGRLATTFNLMLERIAGLVNDLRATQGRLRRFVGDASHELRTPIAAVSAYTDLLREGAVTEPQDLDRVIDGISYETSRMAQLVEDLLTLAKLDEHRGLEREPVELVGLVIEAAGTSNLLGPPWPIKFRGDEPVEVLGDYSALRQVVDNLLSNVRAHTTPGTRAVVSARREGDEAVIEVADSGPGVTEEQAAQMFERFFRSDSSRSRKTGGAGLGLAIVSSIVEAHGGSVDAAPGDQGGTVVTVRLPILEPEPEPELDPEQEPGALPGLDQRA